MYKYAARVFLGVIHRQVNFQPKNRAKKQGKREWRPRNVCLHNAPGHLTEYI